MKYLRKYASKEVMYHGTSSGEGDERLRKILKEGLNPGAPKVFDESEGDWSDKELKTLGGVYLSPSIETANEYTDSAVNKFGGDNVIVIVQLETRTPSVSIDEDTFFSPLNYTTDLGLSVYYPDIRKSSDTRGIPKIIDLLSDRKTDWTKIAEAFLNRMLAQERLRITEKSKSSIIPILEDLLNVQARYYLSKRYDPDVSWGEEYKGFGVEDPNQLLQEYRELMDDFLESMKAASTPTAERLRELSEGTNLRTKELINYRGANKIIGILRWEEIARKVYKRGNRRLFDIPYRIIGAVVYSTPEAKEAVNKVIETASEGPSQTGIFWMDRAGNAIIDKPSPVLKKKKKKAAETLFVGDYVYHLAQPACPIRSLLYGGIETGGGFGSTTELEAGAQRMAEAIHCILGSLGKNLGKTSNQWENMLKVEKGHLREEMGIVKDVLKEYSRSVYTDAINYPEDMGYYPKDLERVKAYIEDSILNMKEASTKLFDNVLRLGKDFLAQTDLPPNVQLAARLSYGLLGTLAIAVENAVKRRPISNPFHNSKLNLQVNKLDNAVNRLLDDGPGQ